MVVTGRSVDVESNPNESLKSSSLANDGNGSSVVVLGSSVVFTFAIKSKLKFNGFAGFLLLLPLSISLKKLFAKFSDSISNESASEDVVSSLRIVVAAVDDRTKVKMLSIDDDFTSGAISLTFEIVYYIYFHSLMST